MAGRTLVHQESRNWPPLLGAGTLNCKVPRSRLDPPVPHPKAASDNNADQCDQRASADTESVRNDLLRVPCHQAILKVRPPNSLDYRVRYEPQPIKEWVELPL